MSHLRYRTLIATLNLVLGASVLTGCAGQSNAPPDQAMPKAAQPILPTGASDCPQPRAGSADLVICTMNYQPVCGIHSNDKASSSYSNACGACAEPSVIGYTEGACP
jgi:hypothetical protein